MTKGNLIQRMFSGLFRSRKKREKFNLELEELKKAIIEDPEFRDSILRELEYRTGRRDLLKAGVLGLLGLGIGLSGSIAYNTDIDNNTVRDVVSDYTGVKVPKPCTCIVAQDGTGDYDVSLKEDASEVIQKAIDYAHSKGGGEVRIREGEYLVEGTIKIDKKILLLISAYNAIFKNIGNEKEPVFLFHNNSRITNLQKLEGAVFERGNGIKIIDTYHVIIECCIFKDCNIGIELNNKNQWTESTTIQNCEFRKCNIAILFSNKGEHSSFAQTRIYNVDIGGCDVGIEVDSNSNVSRSIFLNITIWLYDSKIGWKLNGKISRSLITTNFDTLNYKGGIGFQLGKNFNDVHLPLVFCSYGDIATLVDNPYNKKFRIVTTDGIIRLYPLNKTYNIFQLFSNIH